MICVIFIEEVAQLAFQGEFYPPFFGKQCLTDVFHASRKALITDIDPVGICPNGNWRMEYSITALKDIWVGKPDMRSLRRRGYCFTHLMLSKPSRGDAEAANEDGYKIA